MSMLPWLLAAFQVAAATTLVEFSESSALSLDVSPDGSTLTMDLQGIVWTLPASGGAATPLTDPLWQARQPRWTRDGERLVFTALHPASWNLWQVDRAGGPPRQLTDGPWHDRDPTLHPDGQHVVFVSDRSGSNDLWRLRLADGGLEQLSFHASDESQPAISPDGQRIAYISHDASGYHLRLRSFAGAQSTLLSSTAPLAAPSWRTDGSLLMLVRERDGRAEKTLVLVGPDDPLLRPASWGESVAPEAARWTDRNRFIYSADGLIKQRTLGSRRAEVIPFFAVTSVPQTVRARATHALDDQTRKPAHGLRAPRVSPDGSAVVVTALGGLWRLGQDGEAQLILGSGTRPLDPAWSPDGRRIAFVDRDDHGSRLLSISPEGDDLREHLRHPARLLLPVWGPGATRIAVIAAQPGEQAADVLLVPVAGGEPEVVARDLVAPSRPEWVHGQRLLLAHGPRPGGHARDVTTIDLANGQLATLPGLPTEGFAPGGHDGPAVSPDGSSIAFIRDGALWLGMLDTAGERLQTVRRLSDGPAASLSWVGDNRQLVYLAGNSLHRIDTRDGRSQVWPVDLDQRAYSGDPPWVLRARRVFSPAAGGYLADIDIHITGQRIHQVVPRGALPLPERVVDAGALAVLPGLIDLHARSLLPDDGDDGRRWLAAGITTVREPVSDPADARERSEAWGSGQRPGPRLLYGGPMLDGLSSTEIAALSLRTEAQLLAALAQAEAYGQHMILTGPGLSGLMRRQLVELAAPLGIAIATGDITTAAFSGAAAVEGLRTPGGALARLQGGGDLALLATRADLALTPMLARKNRPDGEAALARIAAGGGLIGAGSGASASAHPQGLHTEIARLAAGPLGAAGALRAATLDAAWALGLAGHLGSVSEGKLADLVLVDGDPLENPDALSRIRAVVSGGRFLPVDVLLAAPRGAPTE